MLLFLLRYNLYLTSYSFVDIINTVIYHYKLILMDKVYVSYGKKFRVKHSLLSYCLTAILQFG